MTHRQLRHALLHLCVERIHTTLCCTCVSSVFTPRSAGDPMWQSGAEKTIWSPSSMIRRMGLAIDNEDSILCAHPSLQATFPRTSATGGGALANWPH